MSAGTLPTEQNYAYIIGQQLHYPVVLTSVGFDLQTMTLEVQFYDKNDDLVFTVTPTITAATVGSFDLTAAQTSVVRTLWWEFRRTDAGSELLLAQGKFEFVKRRPSR